jgi:hypothetical protein
VNRRVRLYTLTCSTGVVAPESIQDDGDAVSQALAPEDEWGLDLLSEEGERSILQAVSDIREEMMRNEAGDI